MPVTPTIVDSLNKIDFVGSPKHLYLTAVAPFTSVLVELYIWKGALNSPPAQPNYTLNEAKVSVTDSYISIEIGDLIKAEIEPVINFGSSLTTSTEGVYYQYNVSYISSGQVVEGFNSTTRFATLGWNWNYEGQSTATYNRGAFGFEITDIPKFYSPHITYSKPTFNLNASSTVDMVIRTPVIPPPHLVRCSEEPFLIIYINKFGLFDTFTPDGSVKISNVITKDTYKRTYRNPFEVSFGTSYQDIDYIVNSKQNYLINTGTLTEDMGQLVEEILYSPRVFLVEFKGDVNDGSETPITADNTVVTADNTIITVDNAGANAGTYRTFKQYPVIVTDTDFGRKTRYADKNKMNYFIKFTQSTDKINNIR